MNRRKFGIMAAGSATALAAGLGCTRPAWAAVDADRLKSELTPFGAERAGNADGTIPAWTGEALPLPSGWNPQTDGLMPDFFASDPKVVSIDSSNMDQHADRLSFGLQYMMQKYGFRIDVYPTHRTARAPQWVYDNIYNNALNAKSVPKGTKYGFTDAYGGIPFPILDNDPEVAAAQAMWNSTLGFGGTGQTRNSCNYLVNSEGTLILAEGMRAHAYHPYYLQGGSAATFDGIASKTFVEALAPASMLGQNAINWAPTNILVTPEQTWSYLPGQGRVRLAPDLKYDTPAPSFDDYANSDEYNLWNGAFDRYDWKIVGKKEMYIPANNNKLYLATAKDACLKNFIDPSLVRFELHRVWIVDAVVSPGKRNVLHHRRFYLDEDGYGIMLADAWDAQGNFWHFGYNTTEYRADLPGGIGSTFVIRDVQAEHYLVGGGIWNEAPYNQPIDWAIPPLNLFNPRTLGAQDQF